MRDQSTIVQAQLPHDRNLVMSIALMIAKLLRCNNSVAG